MLEDRRPAVTRRVLVIIAASLCVLATLTWRSQITHAQTGTSAEPSTTVIESSGVNPDAATPNPAQLLDTDLTAGIVASWQFDEGRGTNVADSSKNGHGATLIGAPLPIWTTGISANALLFDGVQNYASVPNAPDLTPRNV
jgi:hypothetical protein